MRRPSRLLSRLAIGAVAVLVLVLLVVIAASVYGGRWLQRNPQFAERADRVQAIAEYYSLKWTSSYLQDGQESYDVHCASCHGKDGSGGRGSDLRLSDIVLTSSPTPLYSIIRQGRNAGGMPLFPPTLLPASEAYKLIAYVKHSSSRTPADQVRGDRQKGEQIYRGKGGCMACHVVGSEPSRGVMAFSLDGIGSRRSASFLRESLLDPNADVSLQHRPVSVQTAGGTDLSGTIVAEDTFELLLRDSAGNLHSFDKTELRSINKPEHSLMPSYRGRLSEAELDDLVAYLLSLR